MKVVAIGADISNNDVSVSKSLVENIEKDMRKSVLFHAGRFDSLQPAAELFQGSGCFVDLL